MAYLVLVIDTADGIDRINEQINKSADKQFEGVQTLLKYLEKDISIQCTIRDTDPSVSTSGSNSTQKLFDLKTTGELPPTAPSGLVASDLFCNDLTTFVLSWTDNSDDETNFIVEYSDSEDGPWTINATVDADDEEYTLANLPAVWTTLYFRVTACNNAGFGYSDVLAVDAENECTPVAPDAPTDLSAIINCDNHEQLTISWTDNSDNETGFIIEEGESAEGPWVELDTAAADATEKLCTVTPDEATYYLRVGAVNGAGTTYSDPLTFDAQTWINANCPI